MKKIYFIQNADSDFFDRHLVFAFLKKVNGAIVEGAFEGYTAIVNIASAEKVQTLESNGTMTVTVTAKDSALMPIGSHQVSVKLVDTIGRVTSVRVPVIAEVVKKEGLNGAVTLDDGVQVNATFVEDSTVVELVFDIGATGGISAYSELAGKPSLNGVEINGAKLSAAYGIADASDLTALETKTDAHIADTDIHVTSADKMAWNQKATLSDIAAALVPYSTIAYVDAADQAAARDLALHEADALAHVSALERDTWNDAATDAATAKADAAQAKADAAAAKSTADAVDAKATAAATDATAAKADAAAALTAAQGVDAKATQAQTDAANALTAAQTAQTKAESVESIAQSAETKATAAATDAAAALSAVSGKADAADLTAHTSDTTAHVTAGERAAWNAKADKSDIPDVSVFAKTADLAAVATSGAYSDLSGTPSIPSKTSDLTNDSGFITDISGKQDALTTEQLAACNSGITTAKVSTYDGYATSKANAADLANYLPLSGGQMTGRAISRNIDTHRLDIFGGSGWAHGALVSLYGKDNTDGAGKFYIYAHNGTNACTMEGTPHGALTWGGKSVDCIDSQGDGWIRYTNGAQICWGTFKNSNGATGTVVSYGAAFASEPTVICSQNIASVYCYSKSVSGTATTKRTFYTTDVNSYVCWQAIGKWK